jgi:hypothetical protein
MQTSIDGIERSGAALERPVERTLRAEVRREVSRLLDERQLLAPGPGDEDRIRALIRDHVAAYQRRAATTNSPLLSDPQGVERRIFDALLRLGILQPLMDASAIEEIVCNAARSAPNPKCACC